MSDLEFRRRFSQLVHFTLHYTPQGGGGGGGGEGWVRCPEGREEKRLRKGRGRAEDQAVGTFARNSR